MKKLMIAAAIALAAVASQAASINWTASNIYQPGSTADKIGAGSGLVFYFCAEEVAASAVAAALADTTTTLTEKTTYLSSKSLDSAALDVAGKISHSTVWSKAAGDYTFYGVIFADDDVAENGKYVVTAVTSSYGWDNTGDTNVALGNQKTLTQTASNWSTVAAYSTVPEPTSGLLMLLGFAGLALRRKQK